MQYVYLLIEREFLQSAVPVYKIGRTSQENNKRFLQYPKGSRLIFQINVTDSYFLEQEIISLFKHKYILRTDIGHEYFDGDATNMQIDIFNLVITYNYIVPNTTQLFSEFKQIHKTNMKPVLVQLNRMNRLKQIKRPIEILPSESTITNEKIEVIPLTQVDDRRDADNNIVLSVYPSEIFEGNIRKCETCKYTTRCKSSYDDHMKSKRHHKNLINIPQFQCEFCNKKFETKSGMCRHTQLCTTNKQFKENKRIIQKQKIFTCDTCRYTTNIKSSYDDHMKSKRHSNNLINIPQQECKFCNSIFVTKSGLYKHTRLCTAKKNFVENKKQEEINILREKIREEICAQMCV